MLTRRQLIVSTLAGMASSSVALKRAVGSTAHEHHLMPSEATRRHSPSLVITPIGRTLTYNMKNGV